MDHQDDNSNVNESDRGSPADPQTLHKCQPIALVSSKGLLTVEAFSDNVVKAVLFNLTGIKFTVNIRRDGIES